VRALGEAKVAETLTLTHVHRLEVARTRIGPRANHATLLLFGDTFDAAVQAAAARRDDLELIDHTRLYEGS